MQNQNQVFEDLSRLLSSVAGTMAGAGREAETRMRERLRQIMGGDDMVTRDEFEAVRAMASAARAEADALRREVEALKAARPASMAKPAATGDEPQG